MICWDYRIRLNRTTYFTININILTFLIQLTLNILLTIEFILKIIFSTNVFQQIFTIFFRPHFLHNFFFVTIKSTITRKLVQNFECKRTSCKLLFLSLATDKLVLSAISLVANIFIPFIHIHSRGNEKRNEKRKENDDNFI